MNRLLSLQDSMCARRTSYALESKHIVFSKHGDGGCRGICGVDEVEDLRVELRVVGGRVEDGVLYATNSETKMVVVALSVQEKASAPVVEVGAAS